MESDQLQALQAPLKARYREDAAAALLTLRADGELGGGEGISCSVETGRALVEGACILTAAVTGPSRARATCCSRRSSPVPASRCRPSLRSNLGLAVGGRVLAEGDLDFAGRWRSTATRRWVPRDPSFFKLETAASDEELETLLKLTERYCVVYQTLRRRRAGQSQP